MKVRNATIGERACSTWGGERKKKKEEKRRGRRKASTKRKTESSDKTRLGEKKDCGAKFSIPNNGAEFVGILIGGLDKV